MTEQDDQVLLCLDHALVRTYFVDGAGSEECNQGEIAWFRMVKVRRDTEQVHGPSSAVDQTRTLEVLD